VIPKIIAHRGDSINAPENTFASFQKAVDAGADGIEFDVRLAGDGEAVVIHDNSLLRTAGLAGSVSDTTSDQLARIDVGSWFSDSFSTESVRTLAETLDYLSTFSGTIYIELKCDDSDVDPLTARVAAILNEKQRAGVVVKSFKLGVIPRMRSLFPGIRTAALFAPKIRNVLRKEKYLVEITHELGADELSLHYALATKKLVSKAENRGMTTVIWTADNPRWIKRAVRLGLTAIITNDPRTMLARRRQLSSDPIEQASQRSPR
jgi:glycerophosphoryl diester phosphodiesterase